MSWSLSLNAGKCVAIRFGECRAAEREREPYTLNGTALEYVSSYRDLGVIVDEKLRFHSHIDSVVRKAGGLLGNLLRATQCRSRDFMVGLFVSHIRPIINYCSSVWNVGFLGDARRLEALQRRWTREVEGMRGLQYEARLRATGLYSIWGRLLRLDLIKIWKALHAEEEVGLGGLFEFSGRNSRGHNLKLSVPICRTEVRRRLLAVRQVATWNSLPAEVVEVGSVATFKTRLDAFLGDRLFGVV